MINLRHSKPGLLNDTTYYMWYSRLHLLATSIFKWKNLPEYIDKDFIEKNLFYSGKLGLINSSLYGYQLCRICNGGEIDNYDNPLSYEVITNSNSFTISADKVIVLKNNILEIPTISLIDSYIYRLYKIERAIDTNIALQKYARMIETNPKTKLSILNTINKIQDDEIFVFVNKQLKDTLGKNSQVFNTETPFIVDKLQAQKKEYLNECIESLGINTTNTNKKERLLSDEVNSNNQFVNFNLDIFKNTREEFKETVNDRLNWNIELEVNEDFFENLKKEIGMKGGENNE